MISGLHFPTKCICFNISLIILKKEMWKNGKDMRITAMQHLILPRFHGKCRTVRIWFERNVYKHINAEPSSGHRKPTNHHLNPPAQRNMIHTKQTSNATEFCWMFSCCVKYKLGMYKNGFFSLRRSEALIWEQIMRHDKRTKLFLLIQYFYCNYNS